jgi:hypothetical protein
MPFMTYRRPKTNDIKIDCLLINFDEVIFITTYVSRSDKTELEVIV